MPAPPLAQEAYGHLVDLALQEDLNCSPIDPDADLTASWLVPTDQRVSATIIARRPGVVAGLDVARLVFHRLDTDISFQLLVEDGALLSAGDRIARIEGRSRPLLTGERTALNFLQHLSGVATLTRAHVDAIAGTQTRITDTRKTTPGFRRLEKQAVLLGGGVNHRIGLYDAVLIKENHAASVGGVGEAIRLAREAAARRGRAKVPIFVEAENLDEVRSLLAHAPDRILLDNMPLEQMRQAVDIIRRSNSNIDIEATGNMNLDNVRDVAETGVDIISIGNLTHSAPALDMSMLFDEGN
jgi:nicotinate-nucleotide pyrophosphorylase (carboxylating)